MIGEIITLIKIVEEERLKWTDSSYLGAGKLILWKLCYGRERGKF